VLEAMLEKVHQSAVWTDYATRSLLENTYLNGAAFARYLAERQPEMVQFMKDAGLVGKP
jgi:tripartite-type tricarboxylate transporter receptor subunit TctC